VPSTPLNRAAIYLRVSTEDQAQGGYGLDVQRQQTQAYASAFGLDVVEIFTDEGISGAKGLDERPGLAAVLTAAKEHRFDILITSAIDRIARRASLLLKIWDELEDAGISVVAMKERIDTSTPAGRLARTMFAGIAEYELEILAEQTTAGRDERGKMDGEKGGRVPFGYLRQADGTIIVDKEAVLIIRLIFNLRDAGETLTSIADRLNEAQIPTPRSRQTRYSEAKWYASTVKSVLDNEHAYRGGQRGESTVTWYPLLND
jgi:site-specific DNA recombinase